MKHANKPANKLAPAIVATLLVTVAGTAAAQSSVQMYGVLDVWAGRSESSGSGPATRVANSGGLQTSFWGFAGTEDLGGGLKTIFALEGYILPDTGLGGRTATDALFARNAYVGLQGSAGELKLGRVLNPLFVATALSNPFGGSIRLGPLLMQAWLPPSRTVYGDTSWDNAIVYTTPVVGGLKVATYVSLGETALGTSAHNLGATTSYDHGPWFATVSGQRVRIGPGMASIGETEQKTWFAGGSYNAGVAKVFASLGGSNNVAPDSHTRTGQAGVAVPAGRGSVLLSWAQTRNSVPGLTDTRRNTGAVGYDYFASKRTDFYAVVQADKLSTANFAKTYAVGMRLKY